MPAQTTIQVRRGTAASWTSTNPTLAAGEVGFETDTGKFKIGTGSAVWTSLSYFNPGNTSPLTTKGDLYTYSTTDARLPVGANGYTLVADSSTSTGLAYSPTFFAGKNKIINGDFYINQRNFTSSTSIGYCFDRFATNFSIVGGTTASAQTFTTGAAPVAGYEGANYFRAVTTSQTGTSNYVQLYQMIEDVRTLAGQTATISFWAKATSGTPKIGIEMVQQFGSGGSPSADVTSIGASAVTLSTSWARYSLTVSVPSISGKTIGTTANTSSLRLTLWLSAGSDFNSRTGSIGNQNNTFDIWGVQLEAGSTATQFQTATGTIQGELAACQRYYSKGGNNAGAQFSGNVTSGMNYYSTIYFPVTMRATPTISLTNNYAVNFSTTVGSTLIGTDSFVEYRLATGTGVGLFGSIWTASSEL